MISQTWRSILACIIVFVSVKLHAKNKTDESVLYDQLLESIL